MPDTYENPAMFIDDSPINLIHPGIRAGELLIVVHDINMLDVPDSSECIHLYPLKINQLLLFLGSRKPDGGFPAYSMLQVLNPNGIEGWVDEDCVAPIQPV